MWTWGVLSCNRVGFSVHSNELSGSLKGREFLE
jgi:hypothetical protein